MKEEVLKAVEALKEGKIVKMPGDYGWQYCCNVLEENAVNKLKEVTGENDAVPLTILVTNTENIINYVRKMPDLAWELLDYAERPITIIYPEGRENYHSALLEDGSIAVRVIKEEISSAIVKMARLNLVAISEKGIEKTEVAEKSVDLKYELKPHQKIDKVSPTVVKVGYNGEIKFLSK